MLACCLMLRRLPDQSTREAAVGLLNLASARSIVCNGCLAFWWLSCVVGPAFLYCKEDFFTALSWVWLYILLVVLLMLNMVLVSPPDDVLPHSLNIGPLVTAVHCRCCLRSSFPWIEQITQQGLSPLDSISIPNCTNVGIQSHPQFDHTYKMHAHWCNMYYIWQSVEPQPMAECDE